MVVVQDILTQPVPPQVEVEVDERAARRSLRDQVARLERELADAVAAGFPHTEVPYRLARRPGPSGPRMLGLAELEQLRDDMAERLREARVVVHEVAEEQARQRARLEEMLREPRRHKFEQVALRSLGEPGCGVYRVQPRLGLVGMLAGWWHVKLSSGCPRPGPGAAASGEPPRIPADGEEEPQARPGLDGHGRRRR